MLRRLQAILFPAVFFLLFSPVRGEELVAFTPRFNLTGYYDDNVDFSPQSAISDVYAQISPGIDVVLNLKWLPLRAGYTYTRYQYRNQTDLNRDLHNFSVGTIKSIGVIKHLFLEVQDKYEAVPIDVTQPSGQPQNLTQRNIFSLMPVWKQDLSRKMGFDAGYKFTRVDYTAGSFTGDDYFGHRFFARFLFKVDHSFTVFQRNSYQLKYFTSAPDFRQFVPEAGFRLGLGRRWSVSSAFGYSFDETGDERSRGYVYSVAAEWMPASKINLGAVFRRRRTVDVLGEPYTERHYELFFKYAPAKRLVLDGYFRYYDYTVSGNDTSYISFKVEARYRLNKWSALRAGYIRLESVGMPPEDSAQANRVYLGVNITL